MAWWIFSSRPAPRRPPPLPSTAFRADRTRAPVPASHARPRRRDRPAPTRPVRRSEEHTSELQSLMRNSYAAFFLTKTILNTQFSPHHSTYTELNPYIHKH